MLLLKKPLLHYMHILTYKSVCEHMHKIYTYTAFIHSLMFLFARVGGWEMKHSGDPTHRCAHLVTHTHLRLQHAPSQDDPSCSLSPLLSWCSCVAVMGSCSELRVLLLCDSGSCVSCHGLLLPLSTFLSKTAFFFFLRGFELASQVATS